MQVFENHSQILARGGEPFLLPDRLAPIYSGITLLIRNLLACENKNSSHFCLVQVFENHSQILVAENITSIILMKPVLVETAGGT